MIRSRRPVGLIDCDGPMIDLVTPTVELVRRYIPDWQPPAKWDFHSDLPPDLREMVENLWKSEGFAYSLKPVEGAIDHVRELGELHEIYVVTSLMRGSKTWAYERAESLKLHFDIDFDHVVSTRSKHLVHGTYLIDDKIDHIRAWGKQWAGGHRRALLWKMFHNTPHHNRLGADSWPEMMRLAIEAAQESS